MELIIRVQYTRRLFHFLRFLSVLVASIQSTSILTCIEHSQTRFDVTFGFINALSAAYLWKYWSTHCIDDSSRCFLHFAGLGTKPLGKWSIFSKWFSSPVFGFCDHDFEVYVESILGAWYCLRTCSMFVLTRTSHVCYALTLNTRCKGARSKGVSNAAVG